MKLGMWTIILPRIEVSFLEEWLDYHLSLGIDTIHIYNNGYKSVEKNIEVVDGILTQGHYQNVRELSVEEEGIKWGKKPDADYNLEKSDEEIEQQLNSIIAKMLNRYGSTSVVMENWRQDIEVHEPYPNSQALGYGDAVQKYGHRYDWWITLDPDEYLVLYEYDNVKDFINQKQKSNQYSNKIRFNQRVFDERKKGKSVKSITKWAYQNELTKCFVRNPFIQTTLDFHNLENIDDIDKEELFRYAVAKDIHNTMTWEGANTQEQGLFKTYEMNLKNFKRLGEYWISFEKHGRRIIIPAWEDVYQSRASMEEAIIFHYRGSPKKMGGHRHYEYGHLPFDNTDEYMLKHLDKEWKQKQIWKNIDQPYELDFHHTKNYRWTDNPKSLWATGWDKQFNWTCGFDKKHFKDDDAILDLGCGSKPALEWFETGDKYHLDPLMDEFVKIPAMKKYWKDIPKNRIINEPAEILNSDWIDKFSFILCWNVLDHTYDWKKVIDNIHLYLKNDGLFLVGNDFHFPGLGHPGVGDKQEYLTYLKERFKVKKMCDESNKKDRYGNHKCFLMGRDISLLLVKK